ncbi:hypothetical protein OCH74_07755 [Bifidobacterium thermacidophilum]|uniref:Uncharacterized protein n=1 Tax=Bifidobacterium thermacidophilum TaxID=246618 RepID=A0ABW8KQC0_9BIFI
MISLPFAAGDTASAVYAAHPEYAAHCAEPPFIIIQLPQWIDRATAEAHADPLDWPVIRNAQWAASRYAWKSWGPAPVRNADGLPGIPFCADVPQA